MTKMRLVQNGNLVEVEQSHLLKEDFIEDWIAQDPSILALDVMVIGRQITTAFGGRIDLLGLDGNGDLAIIELKRDKTPRDIVAQVLDYASWVRGLSTKEVYAIAEPYLQKPLAPCFSERFDRAIPDTLNSSHSMVIVASELDESSKRIVEYLAEECGLSINTAFFTVFKQGDQEYLTADWLMDQEEVEDRSKDKVKAPWSGFWFVNAGHGDCRSWEDARKYGFLAAGNGRKYSKPLERLAVGDSIFAYQKGFGYVGFGEVTRPAIMAKDFQVQGKELLELPLDQPDLAHDKNDPEKAEYVIGVEWAKTFPLEEGKRFKGIFANQNIVCKLRDQATVEYLRQEF